MEEYYIFNCKDIIFAKFICKYVMRILLVWVPLYHFKKLKKAPLLGLASIAACVMREGHTVKIIDPLTDRLTLSNIKKEIKMFNPDIVGVSVTTQHFFDACNVVKAAKEINPNCFTVFGGPHPTVFAKQTLRECSSLDIVVRGEGEISFVNLINNIDNLSIAKGITYREGSKIVENEDEKQIENLDDLPIPAFELLPMEKYTVKDKIPGLDPQGKKIHRQATISSCRGCPYNCNFCSSRVHWGKKWRSKSAKRIIEEIKILKAKYNVNVFDFVDDTFAVNKKLLKEICNEMIIEELDVFWSCGTRVEIINKELLTLMKKANCYGFAFGIESGVQKSLDFLNKGITVEMAKKTVETVIKLGFYVNSNFIIGIPGETKDDINTTIKFANNLNLNFVSFSLLTPMPGTFIYEYAIKNDLLLTTDWSKYTWYNPVMKVPGLYSWELKALLIKAYLSRGVNFYKIN
jgi:radical SAM superfamily enzyme YgiQ (UPF0313 family)